jgi:hypothetical protein
MSIVINRESLTFSNPTEFKNVKLERPIDYSNTILRFRPFLIDRKTRLTLRLTNQTGQVIETPVELNHTEQVAHQFHSEMLNDTLTDYSFVKLEVASDNNIIVEISGENQEGGFH